VVAASLKKTMLNETRLQTGFFDRNFFMYYEDVDLGWRCRLAGWSAQYVPTATVYHAFHGSSSRRGKRFVAFQCKSNRLRCLLKNASWRFFWRCLPRTIGDVIWLLRWKHVSGLVQIFDSVRDGIKQRNEVSLLAIDRRHVVEQVWVTKGGHGS